MRTASGNTVGIRHFLVLSVVIVATLLLLTTTCLAQVRWAADGEPVCTATDIQRSPQLIPDGAGGTIVTWEDNRGADIDIYAQRVDSNGNSQWAPDGVAICNLAGSDQTVPQLTDDGAGGAIIVWMDSRPGPTADIFAQRVDQGGNTLWAADGVPICDFPGSSELFPVIASHYAGGATIAWWDNRAGAFDIYAQEVDASGARQWAVNGVPICTAPNDQIFCRITSSGEQGAIITWWDWRIATGDIYAQRVDTNGNTQWTVDGVAIRRIAGSSAWSPQITEDGAGGAIIAWQDDRAGGANPDIYSQKVDAGGNTLWAANGVAVSADAGNQINPQLTGDGDGGAIVSWEDARSGNWDVYTQRVGAGGLVQYAANGVPACAAAGDQVNSQIEGDDRGGAIITWQDQRSGDWDVYAQRVDSIGNMLWTADGVAVCTAGDNQETPAITTDGRGGAIIAWQDDRAGAADANIYAQRVSDFAQTWYLAEGSTAGGFETWVLIQNSGTVPANVTLTYQTDAGTVPGPTLTVDPGTRQTVDVSQTVQTYEVSTMVTSDEPVIAERSMYYNNRLCAHDSIGVCAPAPTWYLAEGSTGTSEDGTFETWVLVQNPGATPATVTLTYQTNSGTVPGPTSTIQPGSRESFEVSQTVETFEVSTLVTADQPVIAERAMYWNPVTGVYRQAAHDSIGVTRPANTWFLAEGSTFGGFETWVLVQNPGATPATVTLTYQTETGTVPGPTRTIQPESRQSFNVADTVETFEVSTLVTSDQPVIAERAMYWNTATVNRQAAHDSIGVSQPANVWSLAEGSTGTNADGTFETWVLVQNPGLAPATVTLTYQTNTGAVAGPTRTIQPGSRQSFNVADTVQTFEVSTLVTSDVPVIAERAMYWNTPTVNRQAAHDSIGFWSY